MFQTFFSHCIHAHFVVYQQLILERIRPGMHADPESKKPLADMKETLIALSWYMALVQRVRPWDFMSEDFLVHQEFFIPLDWPHRGFYCHPSYPAHAAVANLIRAVHRSHVGMLPI